MMPATSKRRLAKAGARSARPSRTPATRSAANNSNHAPHARGSFPSRHRREIYALNRQVPAGELAKTPRNEAVHALIDERTPLMNKRSATGNLMRADKPTTAPDPSRAQGTHTSRVEGP